MKIALKIDADTLRGTREGVPRLADLCSYFSAAATFLFSLGPDHTGRALRRVLRPGFLSKVRCTSVLRHYGLATCLYGTLLPAPDIGTHARAVMWDICNRGFEIGIHAFDHVLWQDNVAHRDRNWTVAQMRAAFDRFADIFGEPASVHGAAGWQMNADAFVAEDLFGFTHASDTRGDSPFFPMVGGVRVDCLQLPTTLPTLDELIGRADLGHEHPVHHLLKLTARAPRDHVYTLHAELEGGELISWMEKLMGGWRQQGYELVSLADLAQSLDRSRIPVKRIHY